MKRITIGSRVVHKPDGVFLKEGYGEGTVIGEWGSWMACRSCYAPSGTCSCEDLYITTYGRGTFEVEFDKNGCRPIHRDWLRRIDA